MPVLTAQVGEVWVEDLNKGVCVDGEQDEESNQIERRLPAACAPSDAQSMVNVSTEFLEVNKNKVCSFKNQADN